MIHISEAAQAHFVKLLEKQATGTNIRVFVVRILAQRKRNVAYLTARSMRLKQQIYPSVLPVFPP